MPSHHLLAYSASPSLNRWAWHDPMAGPGPTQTLHAHGQTRTDNTAVMVALAINGVGIARLADLVGRPLVAAGLLVPVLPERFRTPPSTMYAVMLQERHRLPKVRACIDHLVDWLRSPG
jgi:DNA-binding transcriptional LysR family regulator